ncbi:DUF3304 domain-containing protein [Achromobacter animicus]|uniref:DUF3304 domain-containing protein n=1 Tax=Achromobacter animicus TaxID=1389935 RepID=UPI0024494FC7|nr:DUF3304 domain-containing protein [Achromobacter animicus]MDH0683812.1 DUF3304 domain-containing protein [Achromobacter animicus]
MNAAARLTMALLVLLGLTGCDGVRPKEDVVPVSLTGIDHLPDQLSVQNFWVNGASGHQAGTGGSIVCCAKLPRKWRPDLTVLVSWHVTNWRDCGGERRERRVPVERYEQVGRLYIHFLSDGRVRAISSNISPGYGNEEYLGPQDPIPDKNPWHAYGDYGERCPSRGGPVVMEEAN